MNQVANTVMNALVQAIVDEVLKSEPIRLLVQHGRGYAFSAPVQSHNVEARLEALEAALQLTQASIPNVKDVAEGVLLRENFALGVEAMMARSIAAEDASAAAPNIVKQALTEFLANSATLEAAVGLHLESSDAVKVAVEEHLESSDAVGDAVETYLKSSNVISEKCDSYLENASIEIKVN